MLSVKTRSQFMVRQSFGMLGVRSQEILFVNVKVTWRYKGKNVCVCVFRQLMGRFWNTTPLTVAHKTKQSPVTGTQGQETIKNTRLFLQICMYFIVTIKKRNDMTDFYKQFKIARGKHQILGLKNVAREILWEKTSPLHTVIQRHHLPVMIM